jgi:GTPase SAR1 family protein
MAPHPDRVPCLRVLVVGDSGCGKTTLCSLLSSDACGSSGAPPGRTQGCDVHVRLLHVPAAVGAAAVPHFIELWDVSGDSEAYGALRPLLLSAAPAAGVLFCQDLSRRGSASSAPRRRADLPAAHATTCRPAALGRRAGL